MEKKKIKTFQLVSSDGENELPLADYMERPSTNEHTGRAAANDYTTVKTRLGADTPTIVVHSPYGEDEVGVKSIL